MNPVQFSQVRSSESSPPPRDSNASSESEMEAYVCYCASNGQVDSRLKPPARDGFVVRSNEYSNGGENGSHGENHGTEAHPWRSR